MIEKEQQPPGGATAPGAAEAGSEERAGADDAEPVAEAESAADAEPVAEAEPAADAEPATEAEPAADAEPVAEAEPAADAEPTAEAEPVAETDAERAADLDSLAADNERLQAEAQEQRDQALRAVAELNNVRKRAARDMDNARKYALDSFVKELLPVIDSMELGLNASQETADAADPQALQALREGMELTLKKFFDGLDKFGVAVIDPAGAKFDPQKHEAISMQEGTDSPSGAVLVVAQKGYELNGRLVRPAKVVVAK